MVGLVGLDDGPARPVAAAGPADRLAEELEGALRGPLVGQVQGHVGRNDADATLPTPSMLGGAAQRPARGHFTAESIIRKSCAEDTSPIAMKA